MPSTVLNYAVKAAKSEQGEREPHLSPQQPLIKVNESFELLPKIIFINLDIPPKNDSFFFSF